MAKVIVKFINGEEKAGSVLTLNLNQPVFYLHSEREKGAPEINPVNMDSVKAIYFPKNAAQEAMHMRTETIDKSIYASASAFRLVVEFKDGEIIHGTTLKYNINDKAFYLLPMNPGDKNERICINAAAVKKVDCRKLLGKVLHEQKKISSGQLDTALRHQWDNREKKIGDILIDSSIISEEQLKESLQKQRDNSQLLGEILLEAGYITGEQLKDALHIQMENKKKRLGQILVELKYLTPNDICIALASQFNFPWIDLSPEHIPLDIVKSFPEELVKKFGVIPVGRKGKNTILVATSYPQDPGIDMEIRKYTEMDVVLVIAYEVYIERAINYCFPSNE